MALKTLIFGVDDIFNELKPYYAREVQRGNLEIVAFAVLENNGIRIVPADGQSRGGGVNQSPNFELAIISSHNNFYQRMKFLEAQGIPRNRIIDGRVFKVPNLDFPRLLREGVAYGILESIPFTVPSGTIYPQICLFKNSSSILFIDKKSYISSNATIERDGHIHVGKFSAISWNIVFEFQLNIGHNKANISQYSRYVFDWPYPKEFMSPQGLCAIYIGSDVWIGRGCILKAANPDKPLVIGDGAVIASDSVVVKNVPPYAIVGGNPAQIIKYRFEPHVIDALLRIKWWDWDIDKIHDNFKYFNDIDKFIALHDRS